MNTFYNNKKSFDKFLPDISLIDHRLVESMKGLDAAINILTKHPLSPVLFITAYEPLYRETFNDPFFRQKVFSVYEASLEKIESTMLSLVN